MSFHVVEWLRCMFARKTGHRWHIVGVPFVAQISGLRGTTYGYVMVCWHCGLRKRDLTE